MSYFSTDHRVCWREGICVSPQHFQLQEHYFDTQLRRRIQFAAPLAWGVHQLQVDQSSLARGQFSVLSLEAVLPDGTAISLHDQAEQHLQPRNITEHLSEGHTTCLVYVAIPTPAAQLPLFARDTSKRPSTTGAAPLRYRVEERELSDHASPPNKRRIEVLVAQLRVLFERESQDGYTCLPIARISRQPGQGLILDSTYLPPSISLQATPSLRSTLHRLLETSLSCYRELYARRPRKHDIESRDLMVYRSLEAISTHLPELEHCAKDPLCSPAQAHAVLCRLAGRLWSLFDNPEPIQVPQLRFLDLSSSFSPLIDTLQGLLARCVEAPRPFVEISLNCDGQGLWTADLDDPKLASAERFLLSIRSHQGADQIRELVQTRCKIAAPSQIQSVLDSAVSGAQLHAPTDTAGIALRPGEVHIEFDRHNVYWRDLFAERALALYSGPHELTPEHQPSVLALLPHPQTQ